MNRERGQGMVEYAMIIVLCLVVLVMIVVVLGPLVNNLLTKSPEQRRDDAIATEAYVEYARRDAMIRLCEDTDRYTDAECIQIVGGQP